jgi:hypothetical protein
MKEEELSKICGCPILGTGELNRQNKNKKGKVIFAQSGQTLKVLLKCTQPGAMMTAHTSAGSVVLVLDHYAPLN